jgi:hypothetical protein
MNTYVIPLYELRARRKGYEVSELVPPKRALRLLTSDNYHYTTGFDDQEL